MRPMIALTIFSLLGCAGIKRPDTDLCTVNVPAMHKKCYNTLNDYDDSGALLPDAKAKIIPLLGLIDLNKNTTVDPDGWANLKSYIKELRQAYEQGCGQN